MRRISMVSVVLLAIATGVPARAFDVFLPPAGDDLLPATSAELELVAGADRMPLECSGPAMIRRGAPVGGVVETEMLALSLACSHGIMVRESPTRASLGQVKRSGESFFDVFVEVDVPGLGMLHNNQAARVQSVIGEIPPFGSRYHGATAIAVFNAQEQQVGTLEHVVHDAGSAPKLESRGEVSQVMSCFYECKKDPQSASWLEVTTLMLLNQTTDIPLTADIVFVNGNQRVIARTRTTLSPLDLDEIAVCATLEKGLGLAGVPAAGLIEIALSPTGGAYAWVKNVTGKLARTVADPFGPGQVVSGIGKTECRLVGPNVTTAAKVKGAGAQGLRIARILIEGTGDGAE